MNRIQSHRDLVVWQKAMDLSVAIYEISSRFPKTETYRLTDQICRAAISVAGNIAEGHVRSTAKDYAQFLSIARGSLMETETYLMLSVRLGYATAAELQPTLASDRDLENADVAQAKCPCQQPPDLKAVTSHLSPVT